MILIFCFISSFNQIFSKAKFRRRNTDESIAMERHSFSANVSTFLMRFQTSGWEWFFMKEPDFMLKYSTFIGLIVFVGILGIQTLNSP